MKKLLCKLLSHIPYFIYADDKGNHYKCMRCKVYFTGGGPYHMLWEDSH
jgi:hypothetical protein